MHHQNRLPTIKNTNKEQRSDSLDLPTNRQVVRKETSQSSERNVKSTENNSQANQRIEQKYNSSSRTQNKNIQIQDEMNSHYLRQKTDISSHKFKLYPVINEYQHQKNNHQNKQYQNLDEVVQDTIDIQQNKKYQTLDTQTERNQQDQVKRQASLQQNKDKSIKPGRNLKGIRQFAGKAENLLTNFYFQNKWLKKLKSIFQAARALCRIQILVRPKREQWDMAISKEIDCKQELSFNTTVNAIKIKQWCQMVFTKAFSIIQSEALDDHKLNFIENQLSPLQLDHAINMTTQVFWYFMTSFELFTNQKLFIREFGLIMYKDLFEDQRKFFSKFVTKRTYYLSKRNKIITDEQKVMIYSESIIHNLLQGLMLSVNNPKVINMNKPNSIFLIRVLITLLQYLFMKTFTELPIINDLSGNYKLIQFKLTQINKKDFALQECIQVEKEELIIGTYRMDELSPLFSKVSWHSSIKKCFRRILNNLFLYKF
ncbi:unnamed protein product [Paramecium pentaurelia]|uniref:Uncharacterized protein n=1 Tax=Paramecium pentaurelia TaxID=43138 RepID=A0A8S1UKD1_9CILI|nr:unnamed protein product [Paramecium pentaurelia]